MKKELTIALRMTVVTLVLTGLVYPLLVTALSQVVFAHAARGSFVDRNGAPADASGTAVGSTLIGQRFSHPQYFQGRPSAAGTDGYDAAASSGSNLGPTSQKLVDRVKADLARLQTENPNAPGPVPIELVTTSGSGLDPHVSPEAARWQAPRVAAARGVAIGEVEALVAAQTEGRTAGFLGEPRVNVLLLNLEMDRRWPRKVLSPS